MAASAMRDGLVLSAPWPLRAVISFNREVRRSLLARAANACFTQWSADQHGMRMGLITVIHTFGADLKWHPHLHLLVTEGVCRWMASAGSRPATWAG